MRKVSEGKFPRVSFGAVVGLAWHVRFPILPQLFLMDERRDVGTGGHPGNTEGSYLEEKPLSL